MTRRARAIQGFVEALTNFTMASMSIKMGLNKASMAILSEAEAKESLLLHQQIMQGYLVHIVENNPEQAEALLADLGLNFKAK
jgi:hypothetical protein